MNRPSFKSAFAGEIDVCLDYEDKLEIKFKIQIKQKIPDRYVPFEHGIEETFTGEYYMPSSLNETYDFYHFRNTSYVAEPRTIHVFIEKKSNQLIVANLLICDFEDYRYIQRVFSNAGKNFIGVLESSTGDNPALVFSILNQYNNENSFQDILSRLFSGAFSLT